MSNEGTRKVVCGVIGAGWWGTYAHVPALLAHPRAELVAIQTRDAETAAKIGHDFNIPRVFTSSDELLAQKDLEAVVVSSSPHLHHPQALAALTRGPWFVSSIQSSGSLESSASAPDGHGFSELQ